MTSVLAVLPVLALRVPAPLMCDSTGPAVGLRQRLREVHVDPSLLAEVSAPTDWKALRASLTIDRTVAEVDWITPGQAAAHKASGGGSRAGGPTGWGSALRAALPGLYREWVVVPFVGHVGLAFDAFEEGLVDLREEGVSLGFGIDAR